MLGEVASISEGGMGGPACHRVLPLPLGRYSLISRFAESRRLSWHVSNSLKNQNIYHWVEDDLSETQEPSVRPMQCIWPTLTVIRAFSVELCVPQLSTVMCRNVISSYGYYFVCRFRLCIFCFTHASIAAGVGRAFSRVCFSALRKTAWAINTKLGTVARHALTHRSKSQRSKVTRLQKPHGRTVASDHGRYSVHLYADVLYLRPLPAWVCMSIWLDCLCFLVFYVLMVIVNLDVITSPDECKKTAVYTHCQRQRIEKRKNHKKAMLTTVT